MITRDIFIYYFAGIGVVALLDAIVHYMLSCRGRKA